MQPRNRVHDFWYQDLSGPAEHLGVLLEISPSTIQLWSGGAQSAWTFKLLAQEQQTWKTTDGSWFSMPWSLKLKPLLSQQFSEDERGRILVLLTCREFEVFCNTAWVWRTDHLKWLKERLVNKKAGAAGLIRKRKQERYHKAAEDAQTCWMISLFFYHISQ